MNPDANRANDVEKMSKKMREEPDTLFTSLFWKQQQQLICSTCCQARPLKQASAHLLPLLIPYPTSLTSSFM
jgi:hypothetical protein